MKLKLLELELRIKLNVKRWKEATGIFFDTNNYRSYLYYTSRDNLAYIRGLSFLEELEFKKIG